MPKYDPQIVLDTMLQTCAALGQAVDAMGDLAEKMRSEAFEKQVEALRIEARSLHTKVVPKKLLFQDIVRVVAETSGVRQKDILGRDRTSTVALARMMVMYLAYKRGLSTPQIGQFMDRDHTTILSGIAKIERKLRQHEVQDPDDVQLIAQGQSLSVDDEPDLG